MDDFCFLYYLATNLKLNFNVSTNNDLKCRRNSEFCWSHYIYLFSGLQTSYWYQGWCRNMVFLYYLIVMNKLERCVKKLKSSTPNSANCRVKWKVWCSIPNVDMHIVWSWVGNVFLCCISMCFHENRVPSMWLLVWTLLIKHGEEYCTNYRLEQGCFHCLNLVWNWRVGLWYAGQ
jgi:hypothetical protein